MTPWWLAACLQPRRPPRLVRMVTRSGPPSTWALGTWWLASASCRATRLPFTSSAWACPGAHPTCWLSLRWAGTRCSRSSGWLGRRAARTSWLGSTPPTSQQLNALRCCDCCSNRLPPPATSCRLLPPSFSPSCMHLLNPPLIRSGHRRSRPLLRLVQPSLHLQLCPPLALLLQGLLLPWRRSHAWPAASNAAQHRQALLHACRDSRCEPYGDLPLHWMLHVHSQHHHSLVMCWRGQVVAASGGRAVPVPQARYEQIEATTCMRPLRPCPIQKLQ